MSIKSSIFFVLAVLVVLACAPVQANVIVRPVGDRVDNAYKGYEQQCTDGWAIDCYLYGWGQLSPWGPSTYQSMRNTQLPSLPSDPTRANKFPGGSGAYYATCDYFQGTGTDVNPSTSWLGTDKWNGSPVFGKRLGDITAMDYYSFTSKTPQRWGGLASGGEVEFWTKNGWWNSWQQPAVLELTAEALNPVTNEWERRQFWYRPDGGNFVGDDGLRTKGFWVNWNCLTWGKWYSPQYDSSERGYEFGVYPEGSLSSWYTMMEKSPADVLGAVEYVSTVKFKDWVLSPASDDPVNHGYPVYSIWKSPGWKGGADPSGSPNATGTGKPINFRAGARHQKPMTMYVNGRITDPTGVSSTLMANVAAGGGTVSIAATSAFSPSGTARIDTDDFSYTGRNNTAHTLTGCTGIDVAHAAGDSVLQTVTRGANTMWPNESYGFRGQVDLFTLGFNGTSVTYDFEPKEGATPPEIVATSTKALGKQTPPGYLDLAPIVQGAYLYNPTPGTPDVRTVFGSGTSTSINEEMAQKKFLFKVAGRVAYTRQGPWDGNFRQWQNSYFTIDDGSGFVYTDFGSSVLPAPLVVYAAPRPDSTEPDPRPYLWPGDYASAYGYVEPMRWKNVGTPLIMWTVPQNVTELYIP